MCTQSAIWGSVTRCFAPLLLIAAVAAPQAAFAADVYSQRIIADGPACYYRLDELANGTLSDEMGNASATATGATMGVGGALVGLSSTAMHLTSSVSSAVAGNAAQVFAPGEGSLSVELWARPTTEGYLLEWPRKYVSQFVSTCGFYLKLTAGTLEGAVGPSGRSGGWSDAQSALAADGAWHHLILVVNHGNALLELYIDGALAAAGALASGTDMNYDTRSPSLYFGSTTPAWQADADLDEVAIYKKALTATQVMEHYLAGSRALTVRTTADSGPGSLRSAILAANRLPGAQTIDFAIPGNFAHDIAPTSALPAITKQVTIDGSTQPGYAGSPVIGLVASAPSAPALAVQAGSGSVAKALAIGQAATGVATSATSSRTTVAACWLGFDCAGSVRGLGVGVDLKSRHDNVGVTGPRGGNRIGNCSVAGVHIDGDSGAGDTTVEGNVIGLAMDGSSPASVQTGVWLVRSTGNTVHGNTLVGPTAISLAGPLDGPNVISANQIGLSVAGTAIAGIGTGEGILMDSVSGATIGGLAAADGNTIANCAAAAIHLIASTGNTIDCNRIGTDPTGTVPIGTSLGILLASGSSLNQIGRVEAERPNLIAFTRMLGIVIVDPLCLGNAMVNNSLTANSGEAIDLMPLGPNANDAGDVDSGPNHGQNYPVLTSAGVSGGSLTVTGTLDSATNCAAYPCRVLIYSVPTTPSPSSHGGTETLLGQITVTGPGAFSGTVPATLAGGRSICAAAIDSENNQSELGTNLAVAGPATHAAFVSQPSDTVAGATMAPVSVELLDADGRRAAGESRNVTLALTPTGGPPLGGTLTVAASHGLATFSTLAMSTAGTSYRLGATAPGLTGATSGAFTITPAALDPTGTLIVSDKASAQADDFELVTLTLTARDRNGNAIAGVPAANMAVGGSPSAGLTITQPGSATDTNGRTTATARCANVGTVTFTPSINATVSGHTTPVRFLAGAPVPLYCDLQASRTSGTADGADRITFTLTIRDLQRRVVADVPAAQLQLQANPAAGVSITQPSAATNAGGQTTASAVCTKAGTVTYTLLVGGTEAGGPQTVTYSPGPPAAATSALTADKTTAAASGSELVNFAVTLRDAQGNLCPGVPGSRVLLAASPATGINLVQPSDVTGAGGATGAFCTAVRAGRATFTATLDGSALPGSVAVDFVPGPPHMGVSTVNPDQPTHRANGHDAAIITVTLQDVQGNPVSGVPASDIVISSDRGSAVTITQPTGITNSAGQVTASATTTGAGLVVFGATSPSSPVWWTPIARRSRSIGPAWPPMVPTPRRSPSPPGTPTTTRSRRFRRRTWCCR
ncbi:MAG: Ig-like domain-containing protein [Armatimonadetes bacterium]|nr:Ig-like domain-containing protein [Armatimonadota bacterium]